MSEEKETKVCKYCKSEIPKKAKVCPNCRKKQGGIGKWIVIAVIVIIVIAAISGDDKDKNPQKVSQTPSDDKQTSSKNKKTDDTETQDKSNVFQVGDVVETEDFKITFVSAGEYKSDNEYITPKKGYEYWQFKFKFENTSDTDQNVSTIMDWECYADNSKADQQWIGDDSGLDATLSAGRQTEGTVYFEVPKDSKHIELEYDINYWQDNKIVFVGK